MVLIRKLKKIAIKNYYAILADSNMDTDDNLTLAIALYVSLQDIRGPVYDIKKTRIVYLYGTVYENESDSEKKGFTSFKRVPYGAIYTPTDIVTAIDEGKHVYYWYDEDRIDVDSDIVDTITGKFKEGAGQRIVLLRGNGTSRPEIVKYFDGERFVDCPN